MMLQLEPPVPLETPKGRGFAHVLIDPGREHHLQWVVFLKTGECWTFQNPDVRLQENFTTGTWKGNEMSDEEIGCCGGKSPDDKQSACCRSDASRRLFDHLSAMSPDGSPPPGDWGSAPGTKMKQDGTKFPDEFLKKAGAARLGSYGPTADPKAGGCVSSKLPGSPLKKMKNRYGAKFAGRYGAKFAGPHVTKPAPKNNIAAMTDEMSAMEIIAALTAKIHAERAQDLAVAEEGYEGAYKIIQNLMERANETEERVRRECYEECSKILDQIREKQESDFQEQDKFVNKQYGVAYAEIQAEKEKTKAAEEKLGTLEAELQGQFDQKLKQMEIELCEEYDKKLKHMREFIVDRVDLYLKQHPKLCLEEYVSEQRSQEIAKLAMEWERPATEHHEVFVTFEQLGKFLMLPPHVTVASAVQNGKRLVMGVRVSQAEQKEVQEKLNNQSEA